MPGSALAERAPLPPAGMNPEQAALEQELAQLPLPTEAGAAPATGFTPDAVAELPPETPFAGIRQGQPDAALHDRFDALGDNGDEVSNTDEQSDAQEEQVDPIDARVGYLRGVVDELASDTNDLSEPTRDYIRKGGSIQTALAEIDDLRGKKIEGPEVALQEARQEYIKALASKDPAVREAAEERYRTAVVDAFRHASEHENTASTEESEEITAERLAEERLSIATDLLLSERHRLREKLAEESPVKQSFVKRFLNNNKVRLAMVGGLVGSALATRFGMLPSEEATHLVETGLNLATAFMFARHSRSVVEGVSDRLEARRTAKEAARVEEGVKADEKAADITGRVVERAKGRHSRHEKEYDETEARRYVGRIVLDHAEDISAVAHRPESADDAYAELLGSLVGDEMERVRRKVQLSRTKIVVLSGLSVAAAVAMTGPLTSISESLVIGKEAKEAIADQT